MSKYLNPQEFNSSGYFSGYPRIPQSIVNFMAVMNIICRNTLIVLHNGWKQRKRENFAVSTPWDDPADWKDISYFDYVNDEIETHIDDAFTLCWIDKQRTCSPYSPVQIFGKKFIVNKNATVDEVLSTFNAVVHFSEGAKVNSPTLYGKFTSDNYVHYTDIHGTLCLFKPFKLRGKMTEEVLQRVLSLLDLPSHWKTPFLFVTTAEK